MRIQLSLFAGESGRVSSVIGGPIVDRRKSPYGACCKDLRPGGAFRKPGGRRSSPGRGGPNVVSPSRAQPASARSRREARFGRCRPRSETKASTMPKERCVFMGFIPPDAPGAHPAPSSNASWDSDRYRAAPALPDRRTCHACTACPAMPGRVPSPRDRTSARP